MALERGRKGESSRSYDGEDEKPLKKARYVWEVKGKYHLKDTLKKTNNNDYTEKETNNNDKKRQCCVNSDEDEEQSQYNEVPITLLPAQIKNQDYYISKWQARQIARGFVDNTINSVLESWSNPPPQFDAQDFVDNFENDCQVKDESILMAIQSHGLQYPKTTNQQTVSFLYTNDNEMIEESTMDNFENYQNELIKQNNDTLMRCDDTNNDPIDFLNAAVSVAIQKKGLSYSY